MAPPPLGPVSSLPLMCHVNASVNLEAAHLTATPETWPNAAWQLWGSVLSALRGSQHTLNAQRDWWELKLPLEGAVG